jgi:hypothetical protein
MGFSLDSYEINVLLILGPGIIHTREHKKALFGDVQKQNQKISVDIRFKLLGHPMEQHLSVVMTAWYRTCKWTNSHVTINVYDIT